MIIKKNNGDLEIFETPPLSVPTDASGDALFDTI